MNIHIGIRSIYLGLCLLGAGTIAGIHAVKTAPAATVTGPARVVDGDTVIVNGTSVRLKGVDASERGSVRGEAARRAMIAIVDGELSCVLTGERTHQREVGFCSTAAGVDINWAIIEQGWALSCPRYSMNYLRYEQPAALAVQPRSSYCIRGSR